MNNRNYLLKYSIEYLSKFSSSENNLKRILKSKIQRLSKDKIKRFNLYKEIDFVIEQLKKNNLLNDENYSFTKIHYLASQGKSKIYIKKFLFSKGVENNVIEDQLYVYKNQFSEWEKQSAIIYAKKKNILKSKEVYEKKLAKMARAGFSYDICKKILG